MSRLDGREREAGDGEGAGEKDSRRNPDAAQVVPCHVGADTCLGKSAGQASKGAGGCSRCLVPDSWTETYLGRQTKTVRISRSVEYLDDKSPASLLGQACGLAGGMGKPQLIFFNRRRYCMQRDPCRWQLAAGRLRYAVRSVPLWTRLPPWWFYLTTTTNKSAAALGAAPRAASCEAATQIAVEMERPATSTGYVSCRHQTMVPACACLHTCTPAFAPA